MPDSTLLPTEFSVTYQLGQPLSERNDLGEAMRRYPLGMAVSEIRASLVPVAAFFSADTPCSPASCRGYADLRDDHFPVTLCESAPILGV